MFDSVGRNLDEQAAARSAQSAGLVTALAGAVAAAVVLGGLWVADEVMEELPEMEEVFDVALFEDPDADDMEAPPPPPPPPPPPSASDDEEEEEEDDDAEEELDEMLEEVEELEEKVEEEEVKSVDKPKGEEGGIVGGQEGGVIGGVVGGVEGGVIGGSLTGGGPRVVHHSQVEIKRRVSPDYPPGAKGLGLATQRCIATVLIDEKGNPKSVDVDKCPKVFHPATKEALLKWRWWPYNMDGEKIEISTKIAVVYKETG